jgi:hypothetical protein
VRWGAVEVSPDRAAPLPSRTVSREGMGLLMADTDALVRSFESSMCQSTPAAAGEATDTFPADVLHSVATEYAQHSVLDAAIGGDSAVAVPLTAPAERFYALLALQQHDRRWQRGRSYRFETATKVANQRCVELEGIVTDTMTMADLGSLKFNTRRKLAKAMKLFVSELRLRVKMTAFLGWLWVMSRRQRDEHTVSVLRTQMATTQLVNVLQAWKGRVVETQRMQMVARKLERKLGAISVSRVWWAWRDVVLSNDWWRVHVKKCTGIVSRTLLRSRIRHWHGVVVILREKRRELMIAKALMSRARLSIAMESWLQACVISQRQVGMISRVRRAILHLAMSRWSHSTRASQHLWTQLESSILSNVTARWKNRRVGSCFDALRDWTIHQSRQKLILQRAEAKHTHKINETCVAVFLEWLDMVRQSRIDSTERLRLVGEFSTQAGKRKVLMKCLMLWRLDASVTATATEIEKAATVAAEAAEATHGQAVTSLRESLQAESNLQLQRMEEALAATAETAAKSAQELLDAESKARVEAEAETAKANEFAAASETAVAEAAAHACVLVAAEEAAAQSRIEEAQAEAKQAAAVEIAAAHEAKDAVELEMAELQQRLDVETAAAMRAAAETANTAEALATIGQKHAAQVEEAARLQSQIAAAESEKLQATAEEHLKSEAEARAEAQAEATRAIAAEENLRTESERLAAEEMAAAAEQAAAAAEQAAANRERDLYQAIVERVDALYAHAQRSRHQRIFRALRDWHDICVAGRHRLFAMRRKLVRGAQWRTFGAWRNVVVASWSDTSGAGDAWFDDLPNTPMAHMDMAEASPSGHMEPSYSATKVVLIQATARGHLLRKERRKQAKMSAARVKTFLHGCGLSRHWPTAVRHNLTVGALLALRDDQMKALGWSAADRRKLSKGLRLERASMQRWVDHQSQNQISSLSSSPSPSVRSGQVDSDMSTSRASPESVPGVESTPQDETVQSSSILDAIGTEAKELHTQLQAVQLQEEMEQKRLSAWRATVAAPIPEGTPPSPVPMISARGSPRGVQQHAAREFHLVLTALAAGVNYRKFFNGQRSVHVFAGTVGELLGAISVALSEQGISVNGPAELLYADRRSGGDLVVLADLADLPSRASVMLNPVTEGEEDEDAKGKAAADVEEEEEDEEPPSSMLAFLEAEAEMAAEEADEEELPNSLLAFNREHSPEPRSVSHAPLTPARPPPQSSPARTPGTAGLTPTRRIARVEELMAMINS